MLVEALEEMLQEPDATLSNSKALREMVLIARKALAKVKK
jgi:hypothetical protein